jgi:hypothetical protein
MRRFALPLAAALAAAAPASAQVPWSVQGQLTNRDDKDNDGHRYDTHQVLLSAGTRYSVSVQTPEGGFDTMVQVLRPGAAEPVAQNDDAGGTLNSRVNFTPERTGVYLIKVLSFSAEGRGPYTAQIEALPPLPPPNSGDPDATERATWRVWNGELAASDADKDGRHYDDYLVHMRAGQTRIIAADAVGNELDLMVQVFAAGNREGDPVDSDDDSGPGFNALLGFRPDADGDYIVRVTSFGDNALGRYRLSISD